MVITGEEFSMTGEAIASPVNMLKINMPCFYCHKSFTWQGDVWKYFGGGRDKSDGEVGTGLSLWINRYLTSNRPRYSNEHVVLK